ncbi:MAG: hypothetical protein PHV17_05795 [Candidatus Omnitrophica bacterium]|nr:hypothetical protein [Candidatus Omnitrophota bacterium]
MKKIKFDKQSKLKKSLRFSFLIFWPILSMLFFSFLWFAPSSILMLLLAATASLSKAETHQLLKYSFWSLGPLGIIIIILAVGAGIFNLCLNQKSLRIVRFLIWLTFSVSTFFAGWFFAYILCGGNAGAADYSNDYLLTFTGGAAGGIALIAQFGIIPWVFYSTKKIKDNGIVKKN